MNVRLTALAKHARSIGAGLVLLRSVGDGSLGGLAALVIVSGMVPVASVYVTRGVVDRLVPAVAAGGTSATVWPLLLWALAAAGLLLIAEAVAAALGWLRTRHEEQLKDRIMARIHAQSARLDLAFYEQPAFFDRLHRAREEATYRPAELAHAFVDVLQSVVTLAGLAAVLVAFGPWLLVVVALGAAPVLFVVATHAADYRRWRWQAAQVERRAAYYDHALTSAEFAAELRVFGWAPQFQAQFQSLRATIREQYLALARRRGVADLAAALTSLAVLGGGVAWVARQAFNGLVSLGQFAAFGQAAITGLTAMRSLLSGLGRVYANSLFVDDLSEFLALEPRIASPAAAVPPPEQRASGLRFRDVTFCYPGATTPALQHFNLHIPAGQRAAIVGPNGAGKSTLAKLACRLYDPDAGAIEIGGIDIRRLELTELRRLVSPLFQEPVRYYQSAGDNIRMGNPAADLTASEMRAASVAAGAAALIDGLPSGYDTRLGKWFDDGVELSTGEWQRVALARTLARPAAIVVLDEPTSALDPWTEADWFARFSEIAAGRTAVIITHRFTTAMQADVIHVMEKGRVVESGTHASLMRMSGRYAAAWTANHAEPRRPARVAS